MLRYWIEQIVAIEMAAVALIVVTLGVVVAAWVAIRRSKR